MKDVLAIFGGQQTGDAPFSGGRKVPRSKRISLNDVPKKRQRAGGEATGDTDADADGPGRPGALEALCTTRLMGQRLFLLKENDIVKEMQDAVKVYSELVTNRPDKKRTPRRLHTASTLR